MSLSSTVRKRIALIAAPILLLLTLGSWAFASPAGASPDDNFHLASIWCGLGEREGLCEPGSEPAYKVVPSPIVTSTCYAFLPEQIAECWDHDESGVKEATWLNTGSLYPPMYYGTMSLFATPDVEASVIAMRLFNAALYVGVLTLVFVTLPRRLRPALVISALGTLVPLGLFIIPSTNPSSWALLSATIVWISTYGALTTTGHRQIALSSLAVLGTVLGAGARADAAMFAVFGVALAFLLGWRRQQSARIPIIGAAVTVLVSAAFFLSAQQGSAVVDGLPTSNPPLTAGQHITNLMGIPNLWVGALGTWGLGWLDTLMPAIVPVFAAAVFFAAFAIGIHRPSRRRLIAIVLAVAALWGVPFVLLARSQAIIGSEVQPRYVLPLMIILLGVASVDSSAVRSWQGPRVLFAGAALAMAATVALHVNITRYTKGTDDVTLDPGQRMEWWWHVAPTPLTLVIVAGLSFSGLLALIAWELSRSAKTSAGERIVREEAAANA